ncbi:MAG TPA: YdiU family protein [Burkholderiaceae bacterium]|nr:YdiU family protein [Burkholderiaceae bacterium]
MPGLIENLQFEHSFASLPASFYTGLSSVPISAPYLVGASKSAAALVGIDPAALDTPEFIQAFAGNQLPPSARPLAQVYSGHQFGVWAGQLGDGRALLLGDLAAPDCPPSGRLEVQLKGSGPTPYSRMADGRAVLRSSIREFLCSEAMAALNIPTSRALCVIGSEQRVMREEPETTAVVTRLAPSFVRFGSFEHWFYNDKKEELRTLADYVIDRFYPELRADHNPYQALLREVTRRTAHLIARWQAVGFMHGVMNTDNMSILGLTIDYGPYGFMEAFNARHICNHSDQGGRYAYNMQPQIGRWNCFALGQALLPLIGTVDETQAALEIYQPEYAGMLDRLLHAKLGLRTVETGDDGLLNRMFALMEANHVDFTRFFRLLGELRMDGPGADDALRDEFIDRAAFDVWALEYRQRLQQEHSNDELRRLAMHAVNPKYVLRNYLAQAAIEQAQRGDFSEVAKLLAVLEHPFDEQPEHAGYAALPPDWASQLEVSCSS